jgi:hypothetical protein
MGPSVPLDCHLSTNDFDASPIKFSQNTMSGDLITIKGPSNGSQKKGNTYLRSDRRKRLQ